MTKKDFFISYTGKDEQWATWIAGTLENSGYKVIVQAWDFNKGQDFVAQMHSALNNCERFIPILSKEYLSKTGWCQREWISALAKDPSLEKGLFIPVWIEYFNPEIDDLGLFATINAIMLCGKKEGQEAEKELLDGVSIENRPRNRPSFPGTKKTSYLGELPFNNFSFKQNTYFTGRNEILTRIYETFKVGHSIASTQVLEGLGGVGKSEIAKQYAFLNSYEYDCIWWVDAEKEISIISAYSDFAHKKRLVNQDEKNTEIIVESVKNWLQHADHNKWLFIFDNAEKENVLEKYLPTQSLNDNRHVLITSRYNFWIKIGATSIDVGVFHPSEATDFLTKRTGLLIDEYQIELAKELGFLALALEYAAAYILVNGKTYKQYLELYRKYGTALLKKKYPNDPSRQTVYLTWKISIDKIKKESAKQFFNLCAFFASENINDNWFVKSSKFLPQPLQNEIIDELDFNDIKVTLKAYSLIKILGNEECDRINMHRLLQQVVKDTLKSEQQGWVDICVQIMNEQIFTDFSTVEYRNRFINMYPHISTITQYLFSNRSEEIANLHFFLGKGLGESADYTEALEYHKKSLVIREKVLGEEHSNTAASYNELGWVYHSLGIYEKALESHQKALTIRKKVCGIDHSDTATSYNDIGWIYFLLGSYERALEYYQNALGIQKKIFGENHPDTANSYNDIGMVYKYMGDKENALEYYQIALNTRMQILGEHPMTSYSYNNIGCIYHELGKHEKALEYYVESLNIKEKILGKEHTSTAISYDNIGGVYYAQGCYKKALEYHQKALTIFRYYPPKCV